MVMARAYLYGSLLLCWLCGLMAAAAATETNDFLRNGLITFATETNAAGGRHFEIRVPDFTQEKTPDGWALSFPGYPVSGTPGSPQVGGLAFLLPGRTGHAPRVVWLNSEFEDRTNFPVAPVAMMERIHLDDTHYRDEISRVTNQAVYACDHFVPPERLEVTEGRMSRQIWVRLVCHPNQYNPRRQILRCHRRIEGLLFFDPAP